ncbi:MAG: HD domain-containing protein [Parcubacteria group bacterium]
MEKIKIPEYIEKVVTALEEAGFEAYLVGGCVRDILLQKEPQDWDIATSAKPENVLQIFPDGKYENGFGTVMLPVKYLTGKEEDLGVVEVTTYRIESKYSDKRHPDEVKFADTLEEDLSRRDFTMNAMALKIFSDASQPLPSPPLSTGEGADLELIDLFGGQKDLENKIIRAVGGAEERFDEDALRMMRAVRFACQLLNPSVPTSTSGHLPNNPIPAFPWLQGKGNTTGRGWTIEENTFAAIKKNAGNLKYISQERIHDEFEKIILSPAPAAGMEMLHEVGLLQFIMPEVEIGYDVTQSHHHYYGPYNTVYKHLIASLEKCPSPKLEVRLAALLHDVGKPNVKRGQGENATFYNHEYVGARMAEQILKRLRFSTKVIEKVVLLVRNHMFYYNVDEVGEAGVRRVVRKVGLENINDLIDVRIADRLGSGVPKAVPYKLRHFKFMVEKVSHDAVSVKQLKINGNDLMSELKMKPGPKIGTILDVLLAEVIEDANLNDKEKLLSRAKELDKEDVEDLRRQAKEKIKEEQKEEEKLIKHKYHVE